jgi:hypothetical protein
MLGQLLAGVVEVVEGIAVDVDECLVRQGGRPGLPHGVAVDGHRRELGGGCRDGGRRQLRHDRPGRPGSGAARPPLNPRTSRSDIRSG